MSNFLKFMTLWTVFFTVSAVCGGVYAMYALDFLFFAVMFCGVRFLSLDFFGKSVRRIKNPPKNTLFLTFDDGPNPKVTPKVLELLDKYGQKATFFFIAEKAAAHRGVAAKTIAGGHAVGSHDLHHRWTSNFRKTGQTTAQIGESVRILEEIANARIKFYRPPVGLSNPHMFCALKKLDLQCVGWSKSVCDGANRIIPAVKRIPSLSDAKDGDIILLHDDCPPANEEIFLQKLEELLVNMRRAGKKSQPLSTQAVFNS